MKRKFKIYITAFCICLSLGLLSCADKFADMNTDPSILKNPEIEYLFTGELSLFEPSSYISWFYDFTNMLAWGQVTAIDGAGNIELLNQPSTASGLGGTIKVLNLKREIDYRIGLLDPATAAQYKYVQAMANSLVIYMGLVETDMYGYMPYSEASRARYTDPVLLVPKYDTQEELFDSFLKDLDDITTTLSNPVTLNGKTIDQTVLGNQDFVYHGDAKKWAKFCNSMKMKIAVRLLSLDKKKALAIAEEVAKNPAGMITNMDDDFIYNQGIEWYHSQDDPKSMDGTITLMNFLVANKDPRTRFFFAKNEFNSKVIQAFFDAEAQAKKQGIPFKAKIPAFILDKVQYTQDADGHKKFVSWLAPGEPWVRYFGLPLTINAINDNQWQDYFDRTGDLHKITLNDKQKSYTSTSLMQMEMYEGNRVYTFPDAPGAQVVQDKIQHPFFASYFSAGEMNLYLAEMKLLGAALPGSAQEYFTQGISCSVKGWDKIAGLNHIPYYDPDNTGPDPNDKSIALQSGELEDLLQQPAYHLTGNLADDLEKVYIQEHINFIFLPNEMFVTERRSGVPKKGSAYLPWDNFMPDGSYYPVPRRAPFFAGSPTDQMNKNYTKALQDQGFSIGHDPVQLNTQRLWYDKKAPNFGEGPNFLN